MRSGGSRGEVAGVRVLPMSDRVEGFSGKTIEAVQREFFLGRFVRGGGRFGYRASGLNAVAGTVVLFQFKARVVACATFLGDERFEKPRGGLAGVLRFDPKTVRTFRPVDADGMRTVWAGFRSFGHVKQVLNPGQWRAFERRLKDVTWVDGD